MKRLKKTAAWFDDRTGLLRHGRKLARHPVPPKTGWAYVFGSATLAAFVLQVMTGVALASFYVPSTEGAYQSLQYITRRAMFGHILRGLHYFGASAMIILIGLHLIRVFITGSYKFPREVNWLSGVLLFFLVLGMAFTGQLLRWDQNAVWSVVVGAEQAGRTPVIGRSVAHFILGGRTVGAATLSRFFALHVFLIPALIFMLVGLHLYLVIRNGISEPPEAGKPVDPATYRDDYERMLEREGKPFWPHAAWRDVVFGVLVIAIVLGFAWAIGPPALGKPPDPSRIHANPRPDWYFLWYFAVLALLPHGTEAYVIVLAPLALAAGLLLPLVFHKGERSPSKRPWAIAIVGGSVTLVAVLTISGERAPWSPDFSAKPLPAAVVGSTSPPVLRGAKLFHDKGCEFCHSVAGHGGHRGPDLTTVADRLTRQQMTLRILNGGTNMPSFASSLHTQDLHDLLAFLRTRTAKP